MATNASHRCCDMRQELLHLPHRLVGVLVEEVRSVFTSAPELAPAQLQQLHWEVVHWIRKLGTHWGRHVGILRILPFHWVLFLDLGGWCGRVFNMVDVGVVATHLISVIVFSGGVKIRKSFSHQADPGRSSDLRRHRPANVTFKITK